MKLLAVLLMLAFGQTHRVVQVQRSPDGRSAQGGVAIVTEDGQQAPKGWLGVSLGNVPESLATQLDVQDGILILNVVKDSPADKAGLEPHDIVVAVGGEDVGSDVADVVKIIGAKQPGEAVELIVLRDGEEKKISANIGERPAGQPQAFAWKIEAAPDAEVEDQVRTRGRFLFKGPEGNWVMRDLGDMDLPDDVKMLIPDAESRNVQVFVENGEKRIRTTVQRDGESLTVEQEGEDGPITVTREDAQGNESTATYESEDELKEGDEEAYEVLQGTGTGTFQFRLNALHDGDFDFDIDVDDALQWHSQFDMDALHESLERAQEAYHEALEQFHQLQGGSAGAMPPMPHMMTFHGGKPRQSFEVRTDGTIEVRVRKGDSELVKLYSSESDLKRREPELYEKYLELMDEE